MKIIQSTPASIETGPGTPPSFGHIPSFFHPEDTILREWFDCLVVCWDLADSTSKVTQSGLASKCWEAQSDVLVRLPGWIRPVLPDVVIPTGDGFCWIFNLDRFQSEDREGKRRTVRIIVGGLLQYQSDRALARPRTDGTGVMRAGNLTVYDSTMLDGRFGIARGWVQVRDCGPTPHGRWLAPVGLPIFMASRLQGLALVGGLTIEAEGLPNRDLERALLPSNLSASKQQIQVKGYSDQISVVQVETKSVNP